MIRILVTITAILGLSLTLALPSSGTEISLSEMEYSKVKGDQFETTTIKGATRVALEKTDTILPFTITPFGHITLHRMSYRNIERTPPVPKANTGYDIGGGFQYFFPEIAPRWLPYGLVQAGYLNMVTIDFNSVGVFDSLHAAGLYYSGGFGIKFVLDEQFFTLFEAELFKGYIHGKIRKTTYGGAGNSTTETYTNTEIDIETSQFFNNIIVGIGMSV